MARHGAERDWREARTFDLSVAGAPLRSQPISSASKVPLFLLRTVGVSAALDLIGSIGYAAKCMASTSRRGAVTISFILLLTAPLTSTSAISQENLAIANEALDLSKYDLAIETIRGVLADRLPRS